LRSFSEDHPLHLFAQFLEIHALVAKQLGEGAELARVDDVGLLLEVGLLGLAVDEEEAAVGGEDGRVVVREGVAAVGGGNVAGGLGQGVLRGQLFLK
jgi:hypothetical protein